jgi:hypothetical protein
MQEKQNKAFGVGDDNALDPNHYSVADPELKYEQFKKQIQFLEDFIHDDSRPKAEKEALKDDLLRFVRGEPASQNLIDAFGGDNKKLDALNYFTKRGSGNPRTTAGLLKAIFNNDEGGLYLNGLVQGSNSFEELGVNLRDAIMVSKANERNANVPEELLSQSADAQVYHTSTLALLKPHRYNIDDKGKPTTPIHDYQIYNKLAYNLSTKFDLNESGDAFLKPLKGDKAGEEGKLYQLMTHLVEGNTPEEKDKVIEQVIKRALGDNEKTDSEGKKTKDAVLTNNGADLANWLIGAIEGLGKEVASYDEFKEGKKSFSKLIETRTALIDLSEKNGLGLYTKDEMPVFLHENEYEQMFKDFAMSMEHIDELVKSDKSIYKTPKALKVDLGYTAPAAAATKTAALVPNSATANQVASLSASESQILSWMNNMIYSTMFDSGNLFMDENDEMNFGKIGLNSVAMNPYLASPFDITSGYMNNFDSVA